MGGSTWSQACSLLAAHPFLLDPRKAGDGSSLCSVDVTIIHCEGYPARNEGCCRAQFLGVLLTIVLLLFEWFLES